MCAIVNHDGHINEIICHLSVWFIPVTEHNVFSKLNKVGAN